MDQNIEELFGMVLEEINEAIQLEQYQNKYQNQVMTLGIRTLTDEVNEENREYELNFLAKAFAENLYERWITNENNNAFVLVNYDKVYGYISVVTDNGIATLNGLYLDPLLRRKGLAKKMLEKVITFCKTKECTKLLTDVAHYNKSALKFYEKCGFVYDKIEKENEGKLKILHYHLDL